MSGNPSAMPYACEDEARQALIDTCLKFSPLALNQGKSGNASLRWHRGGEQGMLITPSGLPYEHTTIDDIAWVPIEQTLQARPAEPSARAARNGSAEAGDPVPGLAPDVGTAPLLEPPSRFDGPLSPSSEWRMHRDLFAARDEVAAIVHVHSPYATTLACLPRIQREGMPAFHYMIAVAGGVDLRCAAYATFGTQALSDAALESLRERRACLLAIHGQLALGASLDEALSLALEVETLSRMYWQALQIGEPVILDDAEMARVRSSFARYGRAQRSA